MWEKYCYQELIINTGVNFFPGQLALLTTGFEWKTESEENSSITLSLMYESVVIFGAIFSRSD